MSDGSDTKWLTNLTEIDLLRAIHSPLDVVDHRAQDSATIARLRELEINLNRVTNYEDVDKIGRSLLPKAIDGDVLYAVWPEYWRSLKSEFRLLVCTKDKKYERVRKTLASSGNHSQTTIVSTIAAAMASKFGVSAGVLVPFCAMCLLVLIRMGKEAFCSTTRDESGDERSKRLTQVRRKKPSV